MPTTAPLTGRASSKAEPPCQQCFPDGWTGDATSLGCEHGTWTKETPTTAS